jgi:S1-C subfamily serine protease
MSTFEPTPEEARTESASTDPIAAPASEPAAADATVDPIAAPSPASLWSRPAGDVVPTWTPQAPIAPPAPAVSPEQPTENPWTVPSDNPASAPLATTAPVAEAPLLPPPPAYTPYTTFGPVEPQTSGWATRAPEPVAPARRSGTRRTAAGFLAIGLLSATIASAGTIVALSGAGLLNHNTVTTVTTQVPAVPAAAVPATSTPQAAPPAQTGDTVVNVVAKVSPAIVTIIQSTSSTSGSGNGTNPFGNGTNPFGGGSNPFGGGTNPFGGGNGNGNGNGSGNGSSNGSSGSGSASSPSPTTPYNLPAGQTPTAVGTGIIFNSNGWILTNHHVVEGADQLTVQMNDGKSYPATVYGIDTLTDLAIVKIDATSLPTATLGNSDTLKAGQSVIAIGNPLGEYTNSVTTGVVSGLNRSIDISGGNLDDLIQTDAAINPGNSGGPLLDLAGNVVGINTAEAGSAQGIGFAIPINLATPMTQQALAGAKLSRPWIGVRYLAIDAGVAAANNLSVDHGAWITTTDSSSTGTSSGPAVESGSPAEKAGLKENDIITAVDGTSVDATHPLVELLAAHNPGDTVTLTVQRGSSSVQIQVTLGTRPASAQ